MPEYDVRATTPTRATAAGGVRADSASTPGTDTRIRPPGPPGERANRRKGKKPRRGRKPRKVITRGKRLRRRLLWRPLLAVIVLVLGYVGVTIEPYLTYPSSDTISARVAEWGRDHHLSGLVTWLENETYQAPPVGGKLSSQQIQALQGATVAPSAAAAEDLPADIPPLAAGSVPDEGVWHPVVYDAHHVPVLEWAGLRPDAQHTSELAYVAWMNQKELRFQLHPGSQQPGGTFPTPDEIPAGQRTGLVATWNGGFKVKPNDSLGGYYEDGQTVRALVAGKASEVFYRDGSIKVGAWGRDLTMTPQVVGVRQNLSLLVDQGQVTAATTSGSGAQWGVTVNNAFFVPRSGVGVTASGDVVYAGGPALSVASLADLLKQAGAVDAMELDINSAWTSYMYYTVSGGGDPADPTPTRLWNFVQPATRYYQPSSRDFVAVYLR
ncbi:phosphodiester glycosidase family protein [Actinospica durhamensis]|uniref:Phosphodiester glycosidase family protein n=1 Tax=Actinospica durhamensis TaxID=1508375 RepID=A0A941ISB7_9ACTN|nr:phosphodiester glycosidase family protein [Actinospica durhamensis]MBR7834748.1 phosphodiester glycosidase family protein [Actinospica durhamensis]